MEKMSLFSSNKISSIKQKGGKEGEEMFMHCHSQLPENKSIVCLFEFNSSKILFEVSSNGHSPTSVVYGKQGCQVKKGQIVK